MARTTLMIVDDHEDYRLSAESLLEASVRGFIATNELSGAILHALVA